MKQSNQTLSLDCRLRLSPGAPARLAYLLFAPSAAAAAVGGGQQSVSRSIGTRRAFTLFEILVVLAILSIVATIGVPAVLQAAKKSPLRQAVSDLTEACQNARMMAILRGERAELIIRASDRTLDVRLAPERASTPAASPNGEFVNPPVETESMEAPAEAPSNSEFKPFHATMPSSVEFKKLVVNLQDMMDAQETRVRFYPNGTCDAFLAHLLSEQNEERKITLEITTGRELIEIIR